MSTGIEFTDEPIYTTVEVGLLTGVSFRRLDNWVRRGYVAPSIPARGSGSARRWSHADIQRVRDVREAFVRAGECLIAAGITVPEHVLTGYMQGATAVGPER